MLNATALYQIAYDAHYKLKNYSVAHALYQELVDLYPTTEEAMYAKTQIGNIIAQVGGNFIDSTSYFMQVEIAKKIADGENIQIEYGDTISEEKRQVLEQRRFISECKSSMLLSTGYSFDGYEIVKYIDVVFKEKFVGIGLKTAILNIADGFASLTGSEFLAMGDRLQEIKLELRDEMINEAANKGANALIGIDFESSAVGGAVFLVSMTATLVQIVKKA